MDYEQTIDTYNSLRATCLKIAQNKPELFGIDAWLMYAIMDSDITLFFHPGFIGCTGSCYTAQTMCHEPFSFMIPLDEINPL